MAVVRVIKCVTEPKLTFFPLFICALLHKCKGLLFQPLRPITITLTTGVVAVTLLSLGRCVPPHSSRAAAVSGLFPNLAWLDLVCLFTGTNVSFVLHVIKMSPSFYLLSPSPGPSSKAW